MCHLLQYVYLLASREKTENCKLQNLEYPVPDVQMSKSRPLEPAELANQKINLLCLLPPSCLCQVSQNEEISRTILVTIRLTTLTNSRPFA